jgi:CRP/FNR family transcriptional regulator, anaerobic regulatory protein
MPEANRFVLHRPELFDALRRGSEKIAQLMAPNVRTFAAGETIIAQATSHNLVYCVLKGWAGRLRTLPDGRTQMIMVFLPGDLFAVKSMFLAEHGDAIEALCDMKCELIDQAKLKAAFDQDADIATRCMFQVVEEERRLHNWVVGLGQGSAEERMAQMLLEFRGRLVGSGHLPPGCLEFQVPMTQVLMGQMLGMTNVHVNRTLKTFRERRMVEVRDRLLRILDLPALERVAAQMHDASAAEEGA